MRGWTANGPGDAKYIRRFNLDHNVL